MYVMMPVKVMSKACMKCPRFQVIVEKEYKGSQIDEVDLECKNYDDCLTAVEMYEKGRIKEHDDNGADQQTQKDVD